MKTFYAFVMSCALLLSAAGTGVTTAQTRGRRVTTPKRRASATTRTRGASNAEVGEARGRVADQIKLLTRFLYLFGRISSGVEGAEEQARASNISPQDVAAINRNRASLRQNLENVRDGLDQLELYFRTTPGLERYYARLNGVAANAANAEELAAAGQLDRAGRNLIEVVNRLTDVLMEMQ